MEAAGASCICLPSTLEREGKYVYIYIYIYRERERERERDIIDIYVNKYYTIYVYTIHSTVNEAFNEQLSARGC